MITIVFDHIYIFVLHKNIKQETNKNGKTFLFVCDLLRKGANMQKSNALCVLKNLVYGIFGGIGFGKGLPRGQYNYCLGMTLY